MFIRSHQQYAVTMARECSRKFVIVRNLFVSVRDNVSHPSDSRSVYKHPSSNRNFGGVVLNNGHHKCAL